MFLLFDAELHHNMCNYTQKSQFHDLALIWFSWFKTNARR